VKVLYVSKASRVAAHRDKVAVLAKRVDTTLVVPQRWGGQPDETALPDDPRTIVLPALFHGHNHFHLYRGLARTLDAERPDIVHADEEPYSAVTGQIAALCGPRGIPFVFFGWQNLDKRLPPPFGALRKSVFARAAGGIGGTERAASVLRRAGYRGPLAVIPQMGVSPARYRPDADARARVRARIGIPGNVPVVGFLGRLTREKGVHLLLEAAASLSDLWILVIGGGAEESSLRAYANSLGVSARTRFVGAVPSIDVPEWLAALDMLALTPLATPGWAEQFGRALIEAMACEVAVVGSDSGEIAAVIGDGGIVVPEGSVPDLRAALSALTRDPSERARLARAGRARVLAQFTQDVVVDRTIAFYGEVA
jgi:glycosyltransferase involved in cell wall biosynthesis